MKLQAVIWVLSRMTTAIYGLLLIALASVSGTLLVQGESATNYEMRFGEFWAQVFQVTGLTSLFSSWWFLLCCAFIALSVTACLLHSGRLILRKLVQVPPVPKDIPKRLEGIILHAGTAEDIERRTKRTFGLVQTAEKGFQVYRVGRLNRVGYFVLHISILGVIGSGFVSGVFGYRGIVNLTEGKGSAQIIVPTGGNMRFETLPFTMVNRGFTVDYYASGLPKFYETSLDIIQDKGPVLQRTVQVNKPVRVGPYTLYQSDFGDAGSEIHGLTRNVKENKNKYLQGNVHGVYEDSGIEIEVVNASEHVSAQILPEGASVPQMQSEGSAVDYVVKDPARQPMGFRTYSHQPHVIGVEVETDVYRPVFLGLSLKDDTGWDVVSHVLKAMDDMPDGPISPQAFSALAEQAVKGYPEEKRLSIALGALQAVRVLQQFDTPVLFYAETIEPKLFSGIQVSYDPAVHAFWIFSVLLLVGVLLMIYFPYGTIYCVNYKDEARVFIDGGRYTARLTAWVQNLDKAHHL